jgi:hypothetical protein
MSPMVVAWEWSCKKAQTNVRDNNAVNVEKVAVGEPNMCCGARLVPAYQKSGGFYSFLYESSIMFYSVLVYL